MRALAALGFLLAVAGCDSVGGGRELDLRSSVSVDSREALADARDRWRAGGMESYRMRYEVVCFCAPLSVEVHVEDGRIVASETEGGAPSVVDVDGLYEVALDAYDRGAASVVVRVTDTGPPVPVEVVVDWEEIIADDEVGYHVVAFEAR